MPAVQQAASQWAASGVRVADKCVAVTVTPVNPAAMASAIAQKHGVSLTASARQWLARDTRCMDPRLDHLLQRISAEAAGFQPTDRRSIAQSPVVVAMPQPTAQVFGWPNRELSWADLLAKVNSGNALRTGIVNPVRDAAGLSGLLALGGAAGTGPQAQAATAGALRSLALGSSALREDLLEKFPRSADPSEIATSLSAAPMSEEDVISYNSGKPPVQLAALYLKPAPRALDYPYAVMPEVDPTNGAAAELLRNALNTPAFKESLAAAGLRGADGTVGTTFQAPLGAPAASPAVSGGPTASADGSSGTAAAGAVPPAAISQALGSWAAITLPGRVLAVFDISGSMLAPVPTANNLTRAEVTKRAATQGLALFGDDWAVGVWLFSTELVGNRDWRELVPISSLTTKRAALQESLNQLVPKRGGNTGLYDTALAAYKNVQSTYQAGRVNSVILFTDGKNDDKSGLTRAQLINDLKRTVDPKRPVRMIIIGIGDGVDRQELTAISNATGGGVFTAEDPAKIGEIFLQAISTRADSPR